MKIKLYFDKGNLGRLAVGNDLRRGIVLENRLFGVGAAYSERALSYLRVWRWNCQRRSRGSGPD